MVRVTCEELAHHLKCDIKGDGSAEITGVAPIQRAKAHELTFLSNSKLLELVSQSDAGAVLLRPEHAELCRGVALIVNNPYAAYARAAQLLHPVEPQPYGIADSAVVAPSVRLGVRHSVAAQSVIDADVELGSDCIIGPQVWIGHGAKIGAGAVIDAGVKIYPGVQIGERVQIRAGASIGADGFGFANDQGEWVKIPQLGSVWIGDDVEIGANTTIDRGTLDDTHLGNGVKLDNQIQIAHNVSLGNHTLIAGCTGIAGSTNIGKYCTIGGGVSIVGHLQICDRVMITAQTFIAHNIDKPGTYSSGTPMEESGSWKKNYIRFRSLDGLFRRVRQLEKQQRED